MAVGYSSKGTYLDYLDPYNNGAEKNYNNTKGLHRAFLTSRMAELINDHGIAW